jgi:putative acetyltransferase
MTIPAQQVRIRQATPEDAAQVIAYIKAVSAEPQINLILTPDEFDMPVDKEQEFIAHLNASGNSIMLVAEAGDEIVGVLTLVGGRRRAIRHAATLGITVAKEYRGQGLGTRLMEQVIAWARQGGVLTRIELEVFVRNEGARRLYERLGFQVEGCKRRAIFREGQYLDDLVMGLLLD